MTISDKGVAFIAQFEGFSTKPYVDPGTGGEPITIGYGTTLYSNGTKVTLNDAPISKERALTEISAHISSKVSTYLNTTFPGIQQYQFDSLCSFAYNVGTGGLDSSSLKESVLNHASADEITINFGKWNKGGGRVLPGLIKRRIAEAKLYNTGQYN